MSYTEETDQGRAATEELLEELDRGTPSYKRRIERLPNQQRRVFVSLCMAVGPMQFSHLVETVRLDPRTTASCLTELRRKGYVLSHDRGVWQVQDPWLIMWYRFRRNKSKTEIVARVPDDAVLQSLRDAHRAAAQVQRLPTATT